MEKPWEYNKGYDDYLDDVFDSFPEDRLDEVGDLVIDDEEVFYYYNEGYAHDEVALILLEG
jgi:hypothetical protein